VNTQSKTARFTLVKTETPATQGRGVVLFIKSYSKLRACIVTTVDTRVRYQHFFGRHSPWPCRIPTDHILPIVICQPPNWKWKWTHV